jgi:hypothetical protein
MEYNNKSMVMKRNYEKNKFTFCQLFSRDIEYKALTARFVLNFANLIVGTTVVITVGRLKWLWPKPGSISNTMPCELLMQSRSCVTTLDLIIKCLPLATLHA